MLIGTQVYSTMTSTMLRRFVVPLIMSFRMDTFISMRGFNIEKSLSTTTDANQTSLMRLNFLTTTTWLMICLTCGDLTTFAVYTART
jgi:hypothetical protein